MRKHLGPLLLGATAIGLLILLMGMIGSPIPAARAAMIATPTSARLQVCVKQGTQYNAPGDPGGWNLTVTCNTPSAGGKYSSVAGSTVVGYKIVTDSDGTSRTVAVIKDPRALVTTRYDLILELNLGASWFKVGASVDYQQGQYSNLRLVFASF